MNTQFGKDLTTGSIPKHLIQFALPILIGNLVSTGYSVINTIWVGKLLGKDAVAAIAVSFPIFLAMVALCSGATLATSILVSKAYGAKDNAMIQKTVNNSWAIAIVMILIVTLGGLLLSETMLRMIGTPEDILQLATGYLKISFLSFAGLYISYLISSVLRGIGDTVIPLIFIIVSTVINAVLDPLLIMGVGSIPRLGLNGAALASFISSGAATIMGFIYVKYKYKKEPINPSRFLFERKTIMEILKIGLPSFIQQMLVSMGYAFMTIFVIRFSAASIAAFGVASRIDSIVAMPAIAMMMAASTLTAQNIGAGKSERIKDIFKWGIIINIPVIAAISVLCVSFPGTIMRIFVDEADVIQTGIEYLRIVGVGYLFMIIFYVSNGVITGAGKAISIMVISFISLCVVRIPLAGLLSHTSMGIHGIWFAIVISFAVTTINSLWYYFSGRWKKDVFISKKLN
ncbi:MATE family efflux transporter [Paenibacillus qinlingensis]|uniref:MATE family efflux transporter n=1 Tax=Paenibacillus qinlingensis TaxID=1837343 RepID=UPI00156514DA|nr:MATE family efflux transporter [Paenibacillus qinlingensis]NQX59996.1 MATE family efflux transporter [Paenibacillus qinlingensis]